LIRQVALRAHLDENLCRRYNLFTLVQRQCVYPAMRGYVALVLPPEGGDSLVGFLSNMDIECMIVLYVCDMI